MRDRTCIASALDPIPIAGAIFDCDGILIDSEQPWLDLMSEYLHRLDAADVPVQRLRGISAEEAVATLESLRSEHSHAAGRTAPSLAEVDAAYSAALSTLVAPMPGAKDLVAALSGTVPIAVATNGRRDDVRGLLDRADMLNLFDAIVSVEDVECGKPAPAPYLLAADRLGLDAASVVAFEDSAVGSLAAHRAGCTVIGVNADARIRLSADVRLAHLSQVRFDPSTRSLSIP